MAVSPTNLAAGCFVALVLSNYLVTRTEIPRRWPALFWIICGIDALAAILVLLYGVPGFQHSPMVRFVIGLVILMHLAQNFQVKTRWSSEDRARRLEEEDLERFGSGGAEGER